jgi:hypothetical protein
MPAPKAVQAWIDGLGQKTLVVYRSVWRKLLDAVATREDFERYEHKPEVFLCEQAKVDPDVLLDDIKALLGQALVDKSPSSAELFLRAHTALLGRIDPALTIETPEIMKAWKANQNLRRTTKAKGKPDPFAWNKVDAGLRHLVANTLDTKLMALELSGTTPEVREAFTLATQALQA